MAEAAGCHAVKFQKRTVDVVYTAEELAKPRESPFGDTRQRQAEYGLEFGQKEYAEIDRCCKEATEQVISGKCERCGAEVIRRTLTQWYFKITEYADRLLADMAPLEGKLARAGAADAAELDRPQRGRRGQVRHRGTGPSR